MSKYLNKLTELHCEQIHHKFINHNTGCIKKTEKNLKSLLGFVKHLTVQSFLLK